MDKAQLRQNIKKTLSQITEEQRIEKSRKICHNFIGTEQFNKASVIMIYLSLPHEVDTTHVILFAWQKGKTVTVPKVSWQQRHMIPVEITSLETELVEDRYGLRAPATSVPAPIEQIDLVVAPGLAFDRHGNRLGRGGAFYDRFLASKQLRADRFAFAFSEQLVDFVPNGEHDQEIDYLITEEGVIKCK